ncbi:MAG: RnfABCDGE type electron transport complex subunit D, partial [Candidatus Omnitrophica bacterium]|nr:RnfABCDGE type electron transport complex subunit D [Candidatus Omnitrophota bacterium]
MSLKVTSSPHIFSSVNTRQLMFGVLIGLIPVAFASLYFFGIRALTLILNCLITSLISERIISWLRKKPSTLSDGSAVVTGLLLALILPPSTAWYAATLGSVFAIFIGKHIFGGLGANIFNPALIARAFLMAAYPKMLTTFIKPRTIDAVTSATPLVLKKFSQTSTGIRDLFLGNVSGSLGETSALCILIGSVYLLARKIIDWRIPLSLILTVAVISGTGVLLDPAKGSVLFHLLSGGVLLGAFFMATDPVTTPVTKKGRYIFGIACGC